MHRRLVLPGACLQPAAPSLSPRMPTGGPPDPTPVRRKSHCSRPASENATVRPGLGENFSVG